MSTSSGSDLDDGKYFSSRLGDCEVCGLNQAIYTCPKCEVKTCCLDCVRIHKKELKCSGLRDRTKFIYLKDFTDTDLLSDYRLLEESGRFVYALKRNENKKYTRLDKELPIHLYKLKLAARRRGTVLQFLAHNFTRHMVNTTKYIFKRNEIHWRVEWVFPNVDTNPIKFVDEKCVEKKRLSDLLDKYLNPNAPIFEGSKDLIYYKSVGFNGIKVLLKAEKVRSSSKKFFELDPSESLAENLSGKCIMEFPIIFIVLKDHAYNFEIIAPEDEFDYRTSTKSADVNKVSTKSNLTDISKQQNMNVKCSETLPGHEDYNKKRQRQLLTEKIAEEKMLEIEKEMKQAKKKRPKNLLITTGYSSEESISCSSDDEDMDK